MSQQVIVTVRYAENSSVDLALPFDIPSQVIAKAVAHILGLPVADDTQYSFMRVHVKDKRVVLPGETLGEARIANGDFLEIIQSADAGSLEVSSGALIRFSNGQTVPLIAQKNLIGRKSPVYKVDVDLTDVDDARVVSKKHATIEFSDGKFFITDHGSTNGTRVNGQPLRREEPHELLDQDLLELGGNKGVSIKFIVNG